MIFESKDELKRIDAVESRCKFLFNDKATVDQHKKFQYYCEDVYAKKDVFQDYKREQRYNDTELSE